jgi:hypothetical protein
MPLVLNGATSGATTIQATDAVTATITMPSATGTLATTASPTFTGTTTLTTATVTTLNAPSGVLATQNGMTGIAKAWVSFTSSGSTAIQASFNVSSVTYSASGVYVVNFTTAMPDANFVGVCTCTQGGTAYIATNGTRTTSSLQIKVYGQTGAAADATGVQVAILGN